MTKTISILGTKYDFVESNPADDAKLENSDGYYDQSVRKIVVNKDYEDCKQSIGDLSVWKNQIARHEIVHGFLAESGLSKYSDDEILVEWIAIQFPKMLETFKKVDAI